MMRAAIPYPSYRERGEVIESCTIVTVPPNDVCAPIHDRVPAILGRENYSKWLGEIEATEQRRPRETEVGF